MHQEERKRNYFFLMVCFIFLFFPLPARADTGEVIIITEEERNSRLKGACVLAGISVSLPEGEKDFKDLTLYFYNEAEGVFYETKLKDVEEKSYSFCLPPGTYRLDHTFTQYDGFYNYNYTSHLNVESFALCPGGIEGGEELLLSIEGHFITQYEKCLAIAFKNPSHFPGKVKLTLSGETDLENPTKETYELVLKDGDTSASVLMKAGMYRMKAVLEGEGMEGDVSAWGITYETGDIRIKHHEDTKTEVSVFQKEPEEDKAQEDGEGDKFIPFGMLEFLPFLIAFMCLGVKKFLTVRKRKRI